MIEIIDSIGKRIKLLRKNYRLTQKEFAASVNISQGNLSEMEQDKISPSYDTLIAIVKNYKVSADWVLLGETPNYSIHIVQNPELQKMHAVIDKVMTHPDPEIRTWAKIQFHKAFAEYMAAFTENTNPH